MHQGRRKGFARSPPGPHFIQWVCIGSSPKRNIRPSDRGPASTTTEPTERTVPSGQAGSRLPRGLLPALGRGWCAQPDKASRLFRPAGAPPCLPAWGAPQPPKSRRVYGFCRTLSARSLSENSRGDGTRLKASNFLGKLGSVTELVFLFGK